MIISILCSFLSAICFSILFHVQKKHVLICGIVGAAGWLINLQISRLGYSSAFCAFLSTLVVAELSYLLAKHRRTPVTVFLISGILPLVPGVSLYRTMYSFLFQDYEIALDSFILTFEISGAIAAGIIFVTVFPRLFKKA